MLRWTFAALTLALFTAPAAAGLCSHGDKCHSEPSCAAPCGTCATEPSCAVPCETCHAEPTCCAPAAPSCAAPCDTCDTCAPAAPTCCAPSECSACEPSCAVPAAECGCDTGCHSHRHCAPKKKGCLARLWDLEKRKNKKLKSMFFGG